MGTILESKLSKSHNTKEVKEVKFKGNKSFFEMAKPRILSREEINKDRIQAYKFVM